VAAVAEHESEKSLEKSSIAHGRETDAMDQHYDVTVLDETVSELPLDDEDDDLDIEPPYRAPPAVTRPAGPRGYKPGTRVVEPPSATGIGTLPWWASTDPKVREEGQKAAIARGRRIKTPGQDNIIGMSGSW
jgi:hypothetical protein